MKRVYVAGHPAEAHLVRGLLEAEGIAAEVHGEDLFGARGAVPATPETAPTVWVVEDADAARGLEITKRYESANAAPATDGAPWSCPACGEVNESGFGACWKCGAEAPA